MKWNEKRNKVQIIVHIADPDMWLLHINFLRFEIFN